MPTKINWPTSSAPGARSQEDKGRLINVFSEKLGDDAILWRRVPGLRQRLEIGGFAHARGFLEVGGTLLAVMDGRAFAISGLIATNLGALAGALPVTMARNNRAPVPDIVTVTENGAFMTPTGSAPTGFVDPDLEQPNSVSSLGGYLIFTGAGGKIQATDLNGVVISTLSYTTAQKSPDGLKRGVAFRGQLFAFGENSIEVFDLNPDGTAPFPLRYVTVIQKGIAGTFAVAGWEPYWADELLWVGSDGVVYQLSGYQAVPVSSQAVNRVISSLADQSQLIASVYMSEGHAIWSLSSSQWTWEYNLTTKEWHERASYLQPRWRASQTVRYQGVWLAGDGATGKIFEIDGRYPKEAAEPLVFSMQSLHDNAFPRKAGIPQADFLITPGVGSVTGEAPIETDPKVLISWSNDGGQNWSFPLERSLGQQGQARTRIRVNRTGMTGPLGRTWRLLISDPVHVAFQGATMEVEARA